MVDSYSVKISQKPLGYLSWDALADDKEARNWYKKGVYLLGALGTVLIIILNIVAPEDPVTTAWLIQSGILFGGLAVPVIFRRSSFQR